MTPPRTDRRFFLSLTQILIGLAAALGFAGHLMLMPFDQSQDLAHGVLMATDAAYMTVRLFILEGPDALAEGGSTAAIWMVGFARFLAPVALAGFAVTVSEKLWRPVISGVQSRRLHDHAIIGGWDIYAAELAQDLLARDWQIAVLAETEAQAATVREALGPQVLVVVGPATARRSWRRLRMLSAEAIFWFGSDLKLLQIIEALRGFGESRLDRDRDTSRPTRVFLRVSSRALKRQLTVRQDLFRSSARLRFEPFNIDELSARAFFHERNLFADALAARRTGLHWVFLGWSDSLSALSEQLAKVAPVPGLDAPKITIFATDPEAARSGVGDNLGPVRGYIRWEVCDWPRGGLLPPLSDLRHIDSKLPITGIFLASGEAADLTRALALESAVDQGLLPQTPIWIERAHESDIAETLLRAGVQSAPTRPVLTADMLLGGLDRAARAFHEAYSTYAKESSPWESLDENFRNANRRAADHAKTKLEILGVRHPLGSPAIAADRLAEQVAERLEPLAEAEHMSWSADRHLNGWRYGPERDNQKRLHPSLIPYEELDTYQKDLDRWQVEQLPRIAPAVPLPDPAE